jgi:energy-converting hydrogenase B subunit Q
MEKFGVTVRADSGPGVMHQMTGVIAKHRGNISSIDITSEGAVDARIYFEIDMGEAPEALIAELRTLPVVHEVGLVKTLQAIYGKRIIIMGGGAQVGQVAIGAISEADRHNIRGEHISIDTIPLVGERPLADAVRARWPGSPRLGPGAAGSFDGWRHRARGARGARAGDCW